MELINKILELEKVVGTLDTPATKKFLEIYINQHVDDVYLFCPKYSVKRIGEAFKALSDEERHIIMHMACYHCGTTKLPCHCWNDE